MKKAVSFDLNGVLITSEFLSARFEREYGVSSADFMLALKEIMDVMRRPNAPSAFTLWEPHLKKWGVDLNEEQFFDFWFSSESVDTGALEYVKELKRKGIKVYVLSNNFKERTTYYRSHFPEIFGNLDEAYFSWETGKVKPSREALEYVLKEEDLKPSDVIYFDDSEKNIELAREIGIDAELWQDLKSAKAYITRAFGAGSS